MDEKQKEELRKKMEENEALAESLKEKASMIYQKKVELVQSQNAKKRPNKTEEFVEKEETSKNEYQDSEQHSESKKKVYIYLYRKSSRRRKYRERRKIMILHKMIMHLRN
jgi:hypothetical protein